MHYDPKILGLIVVVAVIIAIVSITQDYTKYSDFQITPSTCDGGLKKFNATDKQILTEEDALALFKELNIPGYERYAVNDINYTEIEFENETLSVWLLLPGYIAIDLNGTIYYYETCI